MQLSDYFSYLLEKFGEQSPVEPVSSATVSAFRNKLPNSLLDFWETKGRGMWLDGLFQFCDPDDFRAVLNFIFKEDQEFRPDNCHVYGYTAFGKLFIWSEKFHSVKIDLIWGTVYTQEQHDEDPDENIDIGVALSSLSYGTDELDDEDEKPLFKRALKTLGRLELGEVYGLRLAPALGGKVRLENLRKYRALEHFSILSQATQFRLVDYSTLPSKGIRNIG